MESEKNIVDIDFLKKTQTIKQKYPVRTTVFRKSKINNLSTKNENFGKERNAYFDKVAKNGTRVIKYIDMPSGATVTHAYKKDAIEPFKEIVQWISKKFNAPQHSGKDFTLNETTNTHLGYIPEDNEVVKLLIEENNLDTIKTKVDELFEEV